MPERKTERKNEVIGKSTSIEKEGETLSDEKKSLQGDIKKQKLGNGRVRKLELKGSLASLLPRCLLNIVSGMLSAVEKHLQEPTCCSNGEALAHADAQAYQKVGTTPLKQALEMLRMGQQNMSDWIIHGMSPEDQLNMVYWIYSLNKSIVEYRGSLMQLQQSPEVITLTALLLNKGQSLRQDVSEQAFSDVFLYVASALSSMLYEDKVIFLPDPIVMEALECFRVSQGMQEFLTQTWKNMLPADSYVPISQENGVVQREQSQDISENEGKRDQPQIGHLTLCMDNEKQSEHLFLLKCLKQISGDIVNILRKKILLLEQRQLLGEGRDGYKRCSLLDDVRVQSYFIRAGEEFSSITPDEGGSMSIPTTLEDVCSFEKNEGVVTTDVLKHIDKVVVKNTAVQKSIGKGNNIYVELNVMGVYAFNSDGHSKRVSVTESYKSESLHETLDRSKHPTPNPPTLWCWKGRIRTIANMLHFIGKESSKVLEELDTECCETICHAVVSVCDPDTAVTLVHALKKRSLKVFSHCDCRGNTPLHNAVMTGNVVIVNELLGLHPAALHTANNDTATPIDVAMRLNHHQIVECLLNQTIKLDPHSTTSIELLQSHFLKAMKIGYTNYLLQLHSQHTLAIDFECTDSYQRTAWFYLKQKEPHVQNTAMEILRTTSLGRTLLSVKYSRANDSSQPTPSLPNDSSTTFPPPSNALTPPLSYSSSECQDASSCSVTKPRVQLQHDTKSQRERGVLNIVSPSSTSTPPVDGPTNVIPILTTHPAESEDEYTHLESLDEASPQSGVQTPPEQHEKDADDSDGSDDCTKCAQTSNSLSQSDLLSSTQGSCSYTRKMHLPCPANVEDSSWRLEEVLYSTANSAYQQTQQLDTKTVPREVQDSLSNSTPVSIQCVDGSTHMISVESLKEDTKSESSPQSSPTGRTSEQKAATNSSTPLKPASLQLQQLSAESQELSIATFQPSTPVSPVESPTCFVSGTVTKTRQQEPHSEKENSDSSPEGIINDPSSADKVDHDIMCLSHDIIQGLPRPEGTVEQLECQNEYCVDDLEPKCESQPSSLGSCVSDRSSSDLLPTPPDIAVTQPVVSDRTVDYSSTEESDSSSRATKKKSKSSWFSYHQEFTDSVTSSSGYSTPEEKKSMSKTGKMQQREQAEGRLLRYRLPTSESDSNTNERVCPPPKQKCTTCGNEESNSDIESNTSTHVSETENETSSIVSNDSEPSDVESGTERAALSLNGRMDQGECNSCVEQEQQTAGPSHRDYSSIALKSLQQQGGKFANLILQKRRPLMRCCNNEMSLANCQDIQLYVKPELYYSYCDLAHLSLHFPTYSCSSPHDIVRVDMPVVALLPSCGRKGKNNAVVSTCFDAGKIAVALQQNQIFAKKMDTLAIPVVLDLDPSGQPQFRKSLRQCVYHGHFSNLVLQDVKPVLRYKCAGIDWGYHQSSAKPLLSNLDVLMLHLSQYFPTYSCSSLHDARIMNVQTCMLNTDFCVSITLSDEHHQVQLSFSRSKSGSSPRESFKKEHFKDWILTIIHRAGYNLLKSIINTQWCSVFGFAPVRGTRLTRLQKKVARVVLDVAELKKLSVPEDVFRNLKDLRGLVYRDQKDHNSVEDESAIDRGKKPKPSKRDRPKSSTVEVGTSKPPPCHGNDSDYCTGTTTATTPEGNPKPFHAHTACAPLCHADEPVRKHKTKQASFPPNMGHRPKQRVSSEEQMCFLPNADHHPNQSRCRASEDQTHFPPHADSHPNQSLHRVSEEQTNISINVDSHRNQLSESTRQEVSAAFSILSFTNSSNSLEVIRSHLTTYSKCCPRHDIQNIVVVGTTCPASNAFGPKRRYSSIKDLKDDTRHAPFNASKSLAGKGDSEKYMSQQSHQVMDRLMPESVRRDRLAMAHLASDAATAELHELFPRTRNSSSHQLAQIQGHQSKASDGNGKVYGEASAEVHPEKSANSRKHDATPPPPSVQRSSLLSPPVTHTHPRPVPGDHKDRLRRTAELLHAQDYPRIFPLSYEGSPPMSLPPEVRIPYIFITGLAYYKMSNHKKSVQYFQQCLQLAEECRRYGDITICNIYIGDIEFAQRKYTEAAERYQTALHHYSRDSVAKDFRMILPTKSAVWSKCGSAFKNASRMGNSVTAYEQAIEMATSKKDKLGAHTSLGNLYQSIGENGRAVNEYEEAITLATELKDNVSLGWNHGNLGNALLGLHQRDKALHHLYKALDMAVDYETTPQAIGRAYNNLGTAYQSLVELDKAEEYYDLALAQAIYGNDVPGQARVYGNIGNLQMLSKQFDRAVPHYTEVMRLSQDKSTITTAHHNRGCAYYDWAEKKMNALIQRTSPKASTTSTTFKVSVHGPMFEHCEEQYRPSIVPDSIQKYYLQGTRDLEYVMKHHEDNFSGIKGSPKGLSLSVSLFETNSRTFHRMQDCLVHLKKSDNQPSRFEDALLVAEQSRARTLGELMLKRRGPQLQHQLMSPPSLDQLKSIVARQDCPVVYLSYTGERLLGWVLFPTSDQCTINMFEVPLSDSEFDGKSFDYHLRYSLNEQLVERSFEMYKPFDHVKDKTDPVVKLYDLVARPLLVMLDRLDNSKKATEESKNEVQKIIIVPDSYTNLLPFTCILDGKTGKFWSDNYYFQIMPSLLTMGILDQLPAVSVSIPVEHQQMLCVVGNPTIPLFKYNNDEWNLGKLPHATKEAEWVSHILKCKPILHEQATKDAVMMRVMNAKVIHLATHGSAVAGFLAFAGMAASSNDTVDAKRVLIYPEEIESLNITPALVVLSSCDSGRGVFKADGIQGMARAFILAGAQAVLTTLWRVPDESACIFMQFFYQYLVEEVRVTQALHKAILSLRCFSKYSQYIHWSGYQLTGRDFQFNVSKSSMGAELATRLGNSSVFPRLDILKDLETAFLNSPRLPTDVQVLHGPPGVKPSEPLIDFIHCHHLHFTGGIFWINCRTLQLVAASLRYITDALGLRELSDLPDIDSQPSLVVLDSPDQIPLKDSPLLNLLKRVNVHIVVISKNFTAPDSLQKSIDRQLIRGTKTIDVHPLSTIHATQRLVHSALKNHHLAPSNKEQAVFEKLAEFTTGSPAIVDMTSSLLDLSLRQTECSTKDALHHFAKQVQLNELPLSKPLSVPTGTNRIAFSRPKEQKHRTAMRDINAEVYATIKKKDSDEDEDEDVWATSAKYDSWQVITVLIKQCNLSTEEQQLLNCLSNFNCSPLPTAYITEIATIITKASHQPHLASSLHTKLVNARLLKVYPRPTVFHSTLMHSSAAEACIDSEFVYVPKFIAEAVWKDMMTDTDKAVALSVCYKALQNAERQSHSPIERSYLLGIGSLLVESYEFNFKLVGKSCFQEMYSLFISAHQLTPDQITETDQCSPPTALFLD